MSKVFGNATVSQSGQPQTKKSRNGSVSPTAAAGSLLSSWHRRWPLAPHLHIALVMSGIHDQTNPPSYGCQGLCKQAHRPLRLLCKSWIMCSCQAPCKAGAPARRHHGVMLCLIMQFPGTVIALLNLMVGGAMSGPECVMRKNHH